MAKPKLTTTYCLRITDKMNSELVSIAEELNLNVVDVLRLATTEYLDRQNGETE